MAYCATCNATLSNDANTCGVCGAPSDLSPPTPSARAERLREGSAALGANIAGLLTYVLGFISGIVFLVLEPYKTNPFVRFHAFQSVFFSAALVAFWIAWTMVSSVLGFASFGVLGLAMAGIGLLIALGTIAYWAFLMFKAYRNERYMIPYLGELAAKQAGLTSLLTRNCAERS